MMPDVAVVLAKLVLVVVVVERTATVELLPKSTPVYDSEKISALIDKPTKRAQYQAERSWHCVIVRMGSFMFIRVLYRPRLAQL